MRFAVLSAIFATGLFCEAQDLSDTRPKLQDQAPETDTSGRRTSRLALPCHYVSIDSDDAAFPSEQLRQSVGLEPEFARRGFALSTSLRLADVRVHLGIITGVVRERTILLQAWDTRSQTTTQENFPWRETVDGRVIATKVIEMLSKLCGEPQSAKLREELSPEQIAERLGSFHRVQATSRTYFAPKHMIIALSAREEIAEWGITASTSPESAEVALIIDHLPSISWEYRLVDLRDGAVLDSGSVLAIQEERAASRIADMLIIHLAKCRPLKQVRTTRANSGAQSLSSDQFGSWKVTQILDKEKIRLNLPGGSLIGLTSGEQTASEKIRLNLQGGSLIGLTSGGQTTFLIDINNIVDIAFDDTAFIRVAEDDPLGSGGEADPYTIALLLVLHQVQITKYRIHIAWNEGNDTRLVSLQASKRELKELFARLAAVVNSQGAISDIR